MSASRGSGRRLRPAREQPPTLAEAIDAFLVQPDLALSSRRSYTQTLGRLRRELGAERPLQWVSGRELERAAVGAWGGCAPATWNRHVATLRSFSAFCARQGWVTEPFADVLARRREPADRTRAIPFLQLKRLWRRDDVAVREKALWRLLYETAARAQEVLSLNVEDVDLENKRARVRSKGGDTEWLHLQSGSARLLPRLIAGRPSGPLFLAGRRPAPARDFALRSRTINASAKRSVSSARSSRSPTANSGNADNNHPPHRLPTLERQPLHPAEAADPSGRLHAVPSVPNEQSRLRWSGHQRLLDLSPKHHSAESRENCGFVALCESDAR